MLIKNTEKSCANHICIATGNSAYTKMLIRNAEKSCAIHIFIATGMCQRGGCWQIRRRRRQRRRTAFLHAPLPQIFRLWHTPVCNLKLVKWRFNETKFNLDEFVQIWEALDMAKRGHPWPQYSMKRSISLGLIRFCPLHKIHNSS